MSQPNEHQRKRTSQHCNLANVIAQTPPLRAFFSAACKHSLAACSRQLQQTMQSYVRAMSIDSIEQKHSDSNIYPELDVVLLLAYSTQEQLDRLTDNRLLVIAWLGMSYADNYSATLMVTTHSSAAARASQLISAFRYLSSTVCSQLDVLRMAPSSVATEALIELSQTTALPTLRQLDLSSATIDAGIADELLYGSWRQPGVVMLDSCHLKSVEVFQRHGYARSATIGMLSQQKHVYTVILVNPGAARTASIQQSLTTAAVTRLSRADYSQLNTFTVTANQLHVRSTAQLITASWPDVTQLDLSGTTLSGNATIQLFSSPWPQLKSLTLSNCNLGPASMSHLLQENWPLLTQLDLSGNRSLQSVVSHIATVAH